MHAFWAMGGYAGYVWSAFAVVGIVLLGNAGWTMYQHRRIVRKLKQEREL